jgi:membrane fusion protein, multidrug efflux system
MDSTTSTTTITPQTTETAAPIAKKGRTRNIIVGLVVLLALLVGIRFLIQSYHFVDTDDAYIDGNIMPISARIAGHIAEVRVVEGQQVKAGDVLVTIDPRDYQAAYDQAKAALDDARAQAAGSQLNVPLTRVSTHQTLVSAIAGVSNSMEGVLAAQHNLNGAIAGVAQAQANAVKTDADLRRYADLLKHENVSQQQYDQALAAAKSNRAAVDLAQASEDAAEQALKQAQDKQRQSEADQKTAQTAPQQVELQRTKEQSALALISEREAQLHQAGLNLSYRVIRAPADGVVGQKRAQVGQNVSIGQDLMSVVPLRDVWVTANFKETQLRHMHSGQSVEIRVDTFSGRKYRGRVTYVGGASGERYSLLPPENATGNYVKVVQRIPVRIDFEKGENDDLSLRPGMSVVPEVSIR